MAFQGFGTPGRPRKSIRDNKFELVQQHVVRTPAKLAEGINPANVVDGLFVSINADGDYISAVDANRPIRMIFTGDTMRMNLAYEPRGQFMDYNQDPAVLADGLERPGVDFGDTVTALLGEIEGIWPAILVDLDGGSINDFAVNDPLTVANGRLKKADEVAGDKVIGYVTATANTLGYPAIQAQVAAK